MVAIAEDCRKIDCLRLEDEAVIVNINGVGEIVAYYENGEMAPVVWFAIYSNGKIVHRVNSKYVRTVTYRQEV